MAENKRPSSAARMRAAGKRPVQLWLTQDEHEEMQKSAWRDGLSLAEFLRAGGLERARKKSSGKTSDSS
jgi:hypothetical protein